MEMHSKRARVKEKIKRQYSVMEDNGVDNTVKLPDDVLSSILLLIPTESLRYTVKYVCKRWFKIITKEILSEVAFYVIQQPSLREFYNEIHFREISEKNGKLNEQKKFVPLPWGGRVRSICKELLLLTEPNKNGALYVYNRIRKVGRTLSLSEHCGGHSKCKCGLALVYDKFRGLYKIVHVFVGNSAVECEIFELQSESLFLERSEWRKIDGPSYVGQRKYYWDDPISVNGSYIYWDVFSYEYILSMDIVEEKFYKIPLPGIRKNYSVLKIGDHSCLGLELPIRIGAAHMWILNHMTVEELAKFLWIKCNRNHAGEKEWQKLGGLRIEGPVSKYAHDVALIQVGDYVIHKRRGMCSVLFGYKPEARDGTILDSAVVAWPLQRTAE